MNRINLAFVIIYFNLALEGWAYGEFPIGRVIGTRQEAATAYMLLEVHQMLSPSQTVFLQGNIPVVVREMMSIREIEGIYYYRAYSLNNPRVITGESVFSRPISQESRMQEFEEEVLFRKKKQAQIILTKGKKAAINKGSLHDVDKRDIYKVVDSKGQSKGFVELYGVGDFMSIGNIQYPGEYLGQREPVALGDQAKFIGNRKVLGFGLMHMLNVKKAENPRPGSGAEKSLGDNLLWSVILKKGWAVEAGLGASMVKLYPAGVNFVEFNFTYPAWLRKSFFYPGLISPFLVLGLVRHNSAIHPPGTSNENTVTKNGFIPFGGLGLEFFSGYRVHLRFDYHYYPIPSLEFKGTKYKANKDFLFGGLTLNW
ncbi:hypothetical protein HY772_08955 [Candidatus Woesearchaeota archaeon]|nr:hypothetical protein [Candidatus Woesearchaeota archaeon]